MSLEATTETFIDIFAPKPDDGTERFNLFLTLIPIPLNIGSARFFAGGKWMCHVDSTFQLE